MVFQREPFGEALYELDQLRIKRERVLDERREEVYSLEPRIEEIDRELQMTASEVIRASLARGSDPTEAINAIRANHETLQAEKEQLLRALGLPASYLSLQYECERCEDSGYVEGELCDCMRRRYARKLAERLSSVLPIQDQSFETFRFDFYSSTKDSRVGISPRENIEMIFDKCSDYARSFSLHSGNLLMCGSTGLGKTYLSTCIARTVTERGYSVVYDTCISMFSSYETVKFNNGEPEDIGRARQAVRRYEEADLLIIDDLGTELSTAYTTTAFYQLLNGRLIARRPMIINTNLLPDRFEKQYSPAIASRLNGEFTLLRFLGEDIRMLKKRGF